MNILTKQYVVRYAIGTICTALKKWKKPMKEW